MAAAPDLMPVLSRGRHKHPSRGACFLEYTSLLAGEPFSDAPACVDRELAAVLRRANDTLSDADRPRLLPLLGRAVGLAVAPPMAPDWRALDAGRYPVTVVPYARGLVALHRRVSTLFMAAIGYVPTQSDRRRYDEGREVELLFWRLMHEPDRVRGRAYVQRLVDRLRLLHDCFDEAVADLGLPRHPAARPEPAPVEWPAAPREPEYPAREGAATLGRPVRS